MCTSAGSGRVSQWHPLGRVGNSQKAWKGELRLPPYTVLWGVDGILVFHVKRCKYLLMLVRAGPEPCTRQCGRIAFWQRFEHLDQPATLLPYESAEDPVHGAASRTSPGRPQTGGRRRKIHHLWGRLSPRCSRSLRLPGPRST